MNVLDPFNKKGAMVGQPMGIYASGIEMVAPKTEAALPLRSDVIRSYRAYSLHWAAGKPVLKGSREDWPTIDKTATCNGSVSKCREHLSSLACTCGVYGLTTREDAYEGQVVADVVLFGIVWPHTKGYKASNARIESLVYHPVSDSTWEQEIVAALASAYDVQVALGEKRKPATDEQAMIASYTRMLSQPMPSIPSMNASPCQSCGYSTFYNGGYSVCRRCGHRQ